MTASADAGPLIVLAKLDILDLLPRLHAPVFVPSAVYDEVVTRGIAAGHADAQAVRRSATSSLSPCFHAPISGSAMPWCDRYGANCNRRIETRHHIANLSCCCRPAIPPPPAKRVN